MRSQRRGEGELRLICKTILKTSENCAPRGLSPDNEDAHPSVVASAHINPELVAALDAERNLDAIEPIRAAHALRESETAMGLNAPAPSILPPPAWASW